MPPPSAGPGQRRPSLRTAQAGEASASHGRASQSAGERLEGGQGERHEGPQALPAGGGPHQRGCAGQEHGQEGILCTDRWGFTSIYYFTEIDVLMWQLLDKEDRFTQGWNLPPAP